MLEILEASCIAWPNPSMWRRIPVAATMAVQAYPSDDTESHAHSPRRKYSRINANLAPSSTENLHSIITNRPMRRGHKKSIYQSDSSRSTSGSTSTGTLETINDSNAYFEWLNGMGIGMPDTYRFGEQELFPPTGQGGRKPTNVDMPPYMPMGSSMGPYLDQRFGLQNFQHEDGRDHFGYLKPPTEVSDTEAGYCEDTQGMGGEKAVIRPLSSDANLGNSGLFLPRFAQDNLLSIDLPNSLAHSLLNQPMPAHLLANDLQTTPISESRPHKEDYIHQAPGPSPSSVSSASNSLKDYGEVGQAAHRPYKAHSISLQAGSNVSRGYRSARSDVNQKISSADDYMSALEGGSMGELVVGNAGTHSIEKGTKRSHDSASTPASAVKSDDNQKRLSPRARLTGLLAHSPNVNDQ